MNPMRPCVPGSSLCVPDAVQSYASLRPMRLYKDAWTHAQRPTGRTGARPGLNASSSHVYAGAVCRCGHGVESHSDFGGRFCLVSGCRCIVYRRPAAAGGGAPGGRCGTACRLTPRTVIFPPMGSFKAETRTA